MHENASRLIATESPRSSDGEVTPPIRGNGHVPVEDLAARIRRYNGGLEPASHTFGAALILLAGAEYGHNVDRLARRTGLDRAFVARCARRLIDNGVWEDERTIAEWEPRDPASGTFWNDVAVAEGKMCRRTRTDGSLEWAPAGFWNKNFSFIDPDADNRLRNLYLDSRPEPAIAGPAEFHNGTHHHAGILTANGTASASTNGAGDPQRAAHNSAPTASTRAEPEPDPFDPEPEPDPVDPEPEPDPVDPEPEPDAFVPPLHHVFRDAVWLG